MFEQGLPSEQLSTYEVKPQMNDLWLHRKQLICLRHHGGRLQRERVNKGGGERERLRPPLKKMME